MHIAKMIIMAILAAGIIYSAYMANKVAKEYKETYGERMKLFDPENPLDASSVALAISIAALIIAAARTIAMIIPAP